MTRWLAILALLATSCAPRVALDPRLEPATAEHGAEIEPPGNTPRLELLADGTLLLDGSRSVPHDEIAGTVGAVFAELPLRPFFPDDDEPSLRVHDPVELWIDARTPFARVRPLLRALGWSGTPVTWLRLGVLSGTGEARQIPARLDVFGIVDCWADERDLFVLEVSSSAGGSTSDTRPAGAPTTGRQGLGTQEVGALEVDTPAPAARVWWREPTETEPVVREHPFSTTTELAAHLDALALAEREDSPTFNVDADPDTPWQAVVDLCDVLAAHSGKDPDAIWIRPPDRR